MVKSCLLSTCNSEGPGKSRRFWWMPMSGLGLGLAQTVTTSPCGVEKIKACLLKGSLCWFYIHCFKENSQLYLKGVKFSHTQNVGELGRAPRRENPSCKIDMYIQQKAKGEGGVLAPLEYFTLFHWIGNISQLQRRNHQELLHNSENNTSVTSHRQEE